MQPHTCDECKLSWHVIFTSPIFESDMNPYLLSVGVTPKMPTRTTLAFFRSKMAAACRDYCRASILKATTKMHQLALSIQTFSHILSLESSYFWHLWVGSDFFIIQECSKIYLCWAEVQNQFKLFLKCWKHQRHSSSERSYVNTCKKNQSYSIRSRCNSPFQG